MNKQITLRNKVGEIKCRVDGYMSRTNQHAGRPDGGGKGREKRENLKERLRDMGERYRNVV